MEPVKLILPYPCSANRYWATRVPKGWTRAVTYVTTEAKAYKAEVGWIAKKAGLNQPTTKPIEINFILIPKNGIVMDLSNCLKISEDAFQGIIYVNDKQVKKITLEYGIPDGKGALIVKISKFVSDEKMS